jgi:hypothetical protein
MSRGIVKAPFHAGEFTQFLPPKQPANGIIPLMPTLTSCLLGATLLLSGGYAGMVLMCQTGVLPAMRDLTPNAFADAWRAMDTYMERLMPPYKGSLMLVSLVTVILLCLQHRCMLAVCVAINLMCSIAGLVLTIRGQLPLNAKIKAGGLSPEEIISIRNKTLTGFRTRFVLAAAAFLALCIGVIAWPAA